MTLLRVPPRTPPPPSQDTPAATAHQRASHPATTHHPPSPASPPLRGATHLASPLKALLCWTGGGHDWMYIDFLAYLRGQSSRFGPRGTRGLHPPASPRILCRRLLAASHVWEGRRRCSPWELTLFSEGATPGATTDRLLGRWNRTDVACFPAAVSGGLPAGRTCVRARVRVSSLRCDVNPHCLSF